MSKYTPSKAVVKHILSNVNYDSVKGDIEDPTRFSRRRHSASHDAHMGAHGAISA